MEDWRSRTVGFGLILAGWLLLTGLIPSAAGPADAVPGVSAAAPPSGPLVSGAAPTGRLISSPRRGPFGLFGEPPPAPAQPAPAPTALPATPEAVAPPEPAPEPEAVATPEPAQPAPEPLLPPTDRIAIPRIALDAKVIDVGLRQGGEMDTAAFAAGRLSFSAQAGEVGNAVIAGHNDIDGEVFRRLPELRPGDDLLLYRGDAAYRYVVVVRAIVRESGASAQQRYENAKWMEPTEGPTTTLISCYPYRVDTHRVIVHAVMVEGPLATASGG
jgi:sortase A